MSHSFLNRCGALLILVLSLLSGSFSQANVGQEYGFGSRTAGLAGAGAAGGFGAFAAYHNPAGLPFSGQKRLLLEVGFLEMNPDFRPIQNIVVANNYTGGGLKYDSVANDYRDTFGTQLGMVYRVAPDFANLTVGLTAYLPLEQVAYMDTGEAFVPEYVLYRSRTQRPQVEAGVGADLTPNFHVGAALHLAYSLTSSGSVFLNNTATGASTMRFSASLKPKLSPVLAVLYTSTPETPESQPRLTLGAVVRFPVASDSSIYLKSAANALGGNVALPFSFSADSALFYDPLAVELGATVAETEDLRTFLQLEFQGWSAFKAPALNIQNPTVESCAVTNTCGIQFDPSRNPQFAYRNIWVPRIGQEYAFGAWTVRAGYAYRPGIFNDDGNGPSGAGNYLDPSKHIITLGASHQFSHFLNFEVPCTLNFHLAYHALVTQHVTKTAGNEVGTPTDSKIGSPGYEAGGAIYGGGLSLTLAF